MPPLADLEKFLVDLATYNIARLARGWKPVTILFDNPYYGWCSPDYIREFGCFSIYKIAQKIQEKHRNLPILSNLIEDISLGKVLGMASLGGSVAIFGDAEFSRMVGARYVRETNIPSRDNLEKLRLALGKPDPAKILQNAERIQANLEMAVRILEEEMARGLPVKFYQKPQHGAYISLQLPAGLLGRAMKIEPDQWLAIEKIQDVCIAALEGHKDAKGQRVAVAANASLDLKNTLRLFIDADPALVEQGVRNLCDFIRRLQQAPQIDYEAGPGDLYMAV